MIKEWPFISCKILSRLLKISSLEDHSLNETLKLKSSFPSKRLMRIFFLNRPLKLSKSWCNEKVILQIFRCLTSKKTEIGCQRSYELRSI
jgi:hypothetical protein